MARHGENIYLRKDGRFEGRYVKGRTTQGRTKFGYIYGYQYTDVQRRLMVKKLECLNNVGSTNSKILTTAEWLSQWLTQDVMYAVKKNNLPNVSAADQ